jgi:hypothetical protein
MDAGGCKTRDFVAQRGACFLKARRHTALLGFIGGGKHLDAQMMQWFLAHAAPALLPGKGASNGASATERSALVTASSVFLILTDRVGWLRRITMTTVCVPQRGSPQLCSLTLTTVSSSPLRRAWACVITNSPGVDP